MPGSQGEHLLPPLPARLESWEKKRNPFILAGIVVWSPLGKCPAQLSPQRSEGSEGMKAEPSWLPQGSGSCGRWSTLTIQVHCREVLSLLANLSISLHPSITHPAATGTRKSQESLKPTGAHAWGCVWSNKEPSVCNSCSVSEHQLTSASAETGFMEEIDCDRVSEDDIMGN